MAEITEMTEETKYEILLYLKDDVSFQNWRLAQNSGQFSEWVPLQGSGKTTTENLYTLEDVDRLLTNPYLGLRDKNVFRLLSATEDFQISVLEYRRDWKFMKSTNYTKEDLRSVKHDKKIERMMEMLSIEEIAAVERYFEKRKG